MKKKIIILVLLIVLVPVILYCFHPIYSGFDGWYEPITGLIKCDSRAICLHEFAHYYNHHNGMISNTYDFQVAAEVYMHLPDGKWLLLGVQKMDNAKPLTWLWTYTKFNKYDEVYALIYEYHQGRIDLIPDYLRRFYK